MNDKSKMSVWMLLMVAALLVFARGTSAAETIPPAPVHYFNDYAHVVSDSTANTLDHQLEQFERDTSNQVRVAIYPKMESDSSIDDYTVRVAQAWHIGMKGKDNGAVLFVFVQDHKMFIQVGYGLEGALPDATCKQIIDQEITPQFKAGNFDAGLTAGVTAILAATKGEYKGNGRTAGEGAPVSPGDLVCFVVFIGILITLVAVWIHRMGRHYASGSSTTGAQGFLAGLAASSFFRGGGGGGFGGGGFGGGGGGGFSSGGGGSFGGGGAGGGW